MRTIAATGNSAITHPYVSHKKLTKMKNCLLILLCMLFTFVSCRNSPSEREKAIAPAKDKSGSVMVDGTKLSYQIEGKGIPCLVLETDPAYYSEKLRDHLEMHFINARYSVEEYTPIPPEDYTLNTLFLDIDTLRAAMGLEKFAIMGHSIHGAVAYEYARRYPEYVSHVIMIGTPPITGPEAADAAERHWASASEERKALYEENMASIKDSLEHLSMKETFVKLGWAEGPKRWHDADFDATVYYERQTMNFDLVWHLFGKLFAEYTMFKDEEHPEVPTFLAIGKSDYVAPYTLWEGKYDTLPNLTIAYFNKSGHTPQLEESDLFDKRLLEWINKN